MWKRIERSVEKNCNDVRGIFLRRYPAFVLSDRVGHLVGIPAFVLHDVTAAMLEPLLQFLTENGYATLTADDYVERMVRGQRGQEREVLLTFDDGHKSLYSVAYPALKRYGLKAVAYIVPGMTPEYDGSTSKMWEASLCNWREITEIHESGVLDIQSHSMYHHSISISDRLMDFVRPDLTFSFLDSDLAPLTQRDPNTLQEDGYGTPVYEWGSRFSIKRAFCESPSVANTCKQYVKENGGAAYFRLPDWRRRLKRIWADARSRHPEARFEDWTEQRDAILEDFRQSKREIEHRLPGKRVRHFCYPWFRGSPLAVQLSAEAGYISNAWGSLPPTSFHQGGLPVAIGRLSPAYMWRLPGKGRKRITAVLWERFSQAYSVPVQ
jgi:hypothetical protein